jgi:hypothetical protein
MFRIKFSAFFTPELVEMERFVHTGRLVVIGNVQLTAGALPTNNR